MILFFIQCVITYIVIGVIAQFFFVDVMVQIVDEESKKDSTFKEMADYKKRKPFHFYNAMRLICLAIWPIFIWYQILVITGQRSRL